MIVDISKHNGDIDWAALAPHVDFAILKATGDLHNGVDPMFAKNAAMCAGYGVPIHAYCFSRAVTPGQAEDEAKRLYEAAMPYKPISYILDLEGDALNGAQVIETANAFIVKLRTLGVNKVGLYTGHWAYTHQGLDAINADWLWIARYGQNDGKVPGEQYKPVACDLWQYTSKGTAPGINGNVDLSVLNGDKPMSYFTKGDEDMGRVLIGSARGDENGRAYGGQPGDQTGREVSTQTWYKHSKGWRVFRAKNPEVAEKIAYDMQAACDNSHIGYDQYDRLTLYAVSEPVGFDCAKVETDCETDCSALVRVCCAYAGVDLPNFNTETEPGILLKSGAFVELTGSKYTNSDEYLRRGDILDTATKGHTVVVLTDGAKAYDTGLPTLKRGDKGEDVVTLQKALLAHGFDVGPDGADGDFGRNTENAVKRFQKANGLKEDGVVGSATWAALTAKAPKYTITIHGVDKPEMEKMRERWPDCEVLQE